jgi:hypothetical protein
MIVTFDLRAGESESECLPRPSRPLDYELAVTTAVKNATVIIRINIVAALIACVVILSPFASPFARHGRSWPTARFTGVEEVSACATDRFAVFGLDPGLGRIPESLYIYANAVP